jgi:hypothetical protein
MKKKNAKNLRGRSRCLSVAKMTIHTRVTNIGIRENIEYISMTFRHCIHLGFAPPRHVFRQLDGDVFLSRSDSLGGVDVTLGGKCRLYPVVVFMILSYFLVKL